MNKPKVIHVIHNVVGKHNGIEVAFNSATKYFYAVGASNKVGCDIEAVSFASVTKKIDKLHLRRDETNEKLKGRQVAVVERYDHGLAKGGACTGKTRTRWTERRGWGGRSRHVCEVEIATYVGGEPVWAESGAVVFVSRATYAALTKKLGSVSSTMEKAQKREDAVKKRVEKLTRASKLVGGYGE